MFQQILTIARNTFVESIRQPVFVVLIVVGAIALVMNVPITAYTLEEDNKMLIDVGFSTLFIVGLMLAAFTATGVLNREVENKTVLTVVSKPVARPMFVIGKYAGVAAAILVACWILAMIFLLSVRHEVMQTAADRIDGPVMVFGVGAAILAVAFAALANYFYHRVFTSTFVGVLTVLITLAWILVMMIDKAWHFQSFATDVNIQMLVGLMLVCQAILIITAVAIAASTRLGQVMTLLICLGVFLVGLVSDYVLGRWAEASDSTLAETLYRIAPNFQLGWPADALARESDFTLNYVCMVSGYNGLYACAILGLAITLFQTRELG